MLIEAAIVAVCERVFLKQDDRHLLIMNSLSYCSVT
jgi:hypothetical protein